MCSCLQGHYFTSFKVPDTYGVYKFVVSYHRDGYTTLDVVKRVRFSHLSTLFAEMCLQAVQYLLLAQAIMVKHA